jgi:hypothetical protein
MIHRLPIACPSPGKALFLSMPPCPDHNSWLSTGKLDISSGEAFFHVSQISQRPPSADPIAMIACQTKRNIRNPESMVWPLAD